MYTHSFLCLRVLADASATRDVFFFFFYFLVVFGFKQACVFVGARCHIPEFVGICHANLDQTLKWETGTMLPQKHSSLLPRSIILCGSNPRCLFLWKWSQLWHSCNVLQKQPLHSLPQIFSPYPHLSVLRSVCSVRFFCLSHKDTGWLWNSKALAFWRFL